MADRRRQHSSPLHGSARGVAYVVVLGGVVLLGGFLFTALVAWVMT